MAKFTVPDSISSHGVTQAQYDRWLLGRSRAHRARDQKRSPKTRHAAPAFSVYKAAIHAAVVGCGGLCEYTGSRLDWHLISSWNNDEAKARGAPYKRGFADMPTVDHVHGTDGRPLSPGDLRVTSWALNDAKGDMSLEQFLDLCRRVLATAGVRGQAGQGQDLAIAE